MKLKLCRVQSTSTSVIHVLVIPEARALSLRWTGIVEVYERKASWLSTYFILKV